MAIKPRPSDSSTSSLGFARIAGLTSINFPFTPVCIKIGSSWPFTLTAKIGDVSCKNWKTINLFSKWVFIAYLTTSLSLPGNFIFWMINFFRNFIWHRFYFLISDWMIWMQTADQNFVWMLQNSNRTGQTLKTRFLAALRTGKLSCPWTSDNDTNLELIFRDPTVPLIVTFNNTRIITWFSHSSEHHNFILNDFFVYE